MEKQKRAKGINKASGRGACSNVERIFCSNKQQSIMQSSGVASAACYANCKTCLRDILTTTARASNGRFKARICRDGTIYRTRK